MSQTHGEQVQSLPTDTSPPFSETDVAVVIVHFGDHDVTARAQESVSGLNPPPGKIYIVNNGPGSWEPADSSSGVEILDRPDNAGYAGAVNAAARAAIGAGFDFVWILNNDVKVDPLALTYFVEAYRQKPELEIIGSYIMAGDLCWFGGGDFSVRTGRADHIGFGQPLNAALGSGICPTNWINGCSMFIPLTSFQRRGWFDESFFLYKEELEWQVRATAVKAGLIRRPLVLHLVGATTGSSNSRLGQIFMARNGLILASRQRGLRRAGWLGAWFLDFVCRPLLRMRWSVLRDHLEGATLIRTEPHKILARL
jgi:GT2 family glycosyltransferase